MGQNFNFSATNTYTGDTTISAGTLTVSGTLADTTDVIPGTYDVDATDTVQSKWFWVSSISRLNNSYCRHSGNDTVSGVISGLGSLVKAGSGILTFSGDSNTQEIQQLVREHLQFRALWNTTDVINSGTYDVDATDTIQSLSGTGAELASGITLQLEIKGDTISGLFQEQDLYKAGSGTLTFQLTYTGDATIKQEN